MNTILDSLRTQKAWDEYLACRLMQGRFNWHEFEAFDNYVEREEYLPAVNSILEGACLSVPRKRILNKMGTGKKRTVYNYTPVEMTILKVLAYQLYKYDYAFAPNCYAFRRGLKACDAVLDLKHKVRGKHLWAYKLDISNYFNSIPIPILLEKLSHLLSDDTPLYNFFTKMLQEDSAQYNDAIVHEQRGVMAGVPTASFLANVYLMEMDWHFYNEGIIYARYSDDIIVFAQDYDSLGSHIAKLKEFIFAHGLEINPSKEKIFPPYGPYEFLGFKCNDHKIDISDSAIEKMKGKIRRKMRSVLRWKERKGVAGERAMTRYISYFNRKFFDDDDSRSLTWSRWYFPMLNSSDGLKTIDHYLQQCIRVLSTGRHNKSNYRVTYEKMKALGYRSLVHEYYSFKSMERSI